MVLVMVAGKSAWGGNASTIVELIFLTRVNKQTYKSVSVNINPVMYVLMTLGLSTGLLLLVLSTPMAF